MLHLFFHANQSSLASSQERCPVAIDGNGFDAPRGIILGRFDAQKIKHIQ